MLSDQFRELNIYTILFRVFLAILIGGIIGMERGRKNQPAGFRTYMLVCMGAALVMMTNQYIYIYYSSGDISRLGAQVISGIGFLGAGSIIVTKKNQVRGLTTAAGLWTSACVGLAIGIGFYEGALVVGVVLFFIMTIFQKIDTIFLAKSTRINIYLNLKSPDYITKFIEFCKGKEYRVVDMQVSKDKEYGQHRVILIVALQLKKSTSHIEIMEEISKLEGVVHLEEL